MLKIAVWKEGPIITPFFRYEKHVSQIIFPFLKSLTAGKRQNQDATELALTQEPAI